MSPRKRFWLLAPISLLARPTLAPAQFTFTTNNGALTITAYSANAATLVIPGATNGFLDFSDADGTDYPARLYRVRSP
jgi:hypothetical protein